MDRTKELVEIQNSLDKWWFRLNFIIFLIGASVVTFWTSLIVLIWLLVKKDKLEKRYAKAVNEFVPNAEEYIKQTEKKWN